VVSGGGQTREQLLDVAERLFGEHGIRNVSLRQIRLTASQRNTGAVQYHFGDREGVVRALSERHTPRLEKIRSHYVARLDATPGPSLRTRVEVYVRPLADYIAQGPSERSWAKMLAELLSDPRISIDMIRSASPEDAVKLGTTLIEELARTLPPELAAERLWAVIQSSVHLCADRARIIDDPQNVRPVPSYEAFAENLVDMALGALTAPVHGARNTGECATRGHP
jgi:AcrR family transcriptional regulator